VIIFDVKVIVLLPALPAVVPKFAFKAKFAVKSETLAVPRGVRFKVVGVTVRLFDALDPG
jgi:hypothetical protein